MVQAQSVPDVGTLEFEVHGQGRNGRQTASKFSLRCDAIGLHDNAILLLSVVGAETSVKALTAGVRSSERDQQRISYAARVGTVNAAGLSKCVEGYRVYRTKLAYGLWHALYLAKRPGFMPMLSEEALWQHLQSDAFTTPLLRDWMPWLYGTMKEREAVVELTQSGCQAGLVLADNDMLDELVTQGLREGQLKIGGAGSRSGRPTVAAEVNTLDEYLLAHGSLLGKQAELALSPLHVPSRDALPTLDLAREPFEAQRHVIEATRKALTRQKAVLLVGEMGTGKTIMSLAAIHAHRSGRPYRALVFCPGQLVEKWEREIGETIPEAEVIQLGNWKTLLRLDRRRPPHRPEWYVIARDRAKLGARWQPACCRRQYIEEGFIRCPTCGLRLVTEDREPLVVGKPGKNGNSPTGLWRRRARCEWVLTNDGGKNELDGAFLTEGCGSPLWQMNGELWRYEPTRIIKRRLRRFFDYLVLDEVHEEKGADTAQGHAAGALAACCGKVVALTGTLIGGYAEHLRPLLFRLAPGSLVQEGLGWSNVTAFNERYGRIETRITERSGVSGEDNRMSRGSKTTTKSVRPGVMPVLFGKHLIDKTVFLRLGEVAANLPSLKEECWPIRMDATLAEAYHHTVEEPLVQVIKEMMRRNDRRLLGTMLQSLLAYPDLPFGWEPIGYHNKGTFIPVAKPWNLPEGVIRPKERALIDLVQSEKSKKRKVWVYVQLTDTRDVQARVEKLLRQTGFQVGVLRSSVPLARREEWIAERAPQLDVVISHPRLVETGLDLFDKNGGHNFPTLCFYETGYNLFTLRQASRRSWRIGQKEECRIVYLYYEGTMQDRAMALMGKKLTAAQALEGSFSSEGLVALAGEDANVEMALARSLVERMDEGESRRHWNKTIQSPVHQVDLTPAVDLDRWLWPDDSKPAPAIASGRKPRERRTRPRVLAGNLLF